MRTETHQIDTYDSIARFHNQEWIDYPPQSLIKQADPSSHISLPNLAAKNICLISSDQPMGLKRDKKPTCVSNHGLFSTIHAKKLSHTKGLISRPETLPAGALA